MRIYLSGAMSNRPNFGYDVFNAVTNVWRRLGHDIINPAENFGGDQTRSYAEYMREDIRLLLTADAIAMLPGWEESKGAKFEFHTAQMLGLPVLDATTMEPLACVPKASTKLEGCW